MNREIKFRVWDNKLSEMTMVSHIMFSETAYMPERVTADLKDEMGSKQLNGLIDAGKHPAFKLMQYTGLKDKNGVEIYENDIVVRSYQHDDLYPNSYDPTVRTKKIVTWIDNHSYLGYNIRRQKDGTCKHLTIIGNIYENKELLNDNL